MKLLIAALTMTLSVSAFAQDCVTADGVTIQNGQSAVLFYVSQPRKQIGPNYTCGSVARVRTCVNGELSNKPVVCSEMDSGGCVDSWIDVMDDASFTFAICKDQFALARNGLDESLKDFDDLKKRRKVEKPLLRLLIYLNIEPFVIQNLQVSRLQE